MAARKKTTKDSAMSDSESIIPRDYADWLASLKSHISSARQRATLAVNQELVRLYHHIGSEILERQTRQGWGAKVIDRVAADLRAAFPEMKGFSSSNLKYMRFFAEKCPTGLIGQQPADQLPWFHLVTLLTKVSADTEREWYAAQVIQHGWSRPTLDVHIKNQLHLRQGVAITNFDRHLPTPHAQLAIEALKDPYLFDFLGLGGEALERDIENALIRHITRFLLELGAGFAFVGRQFRLEVGGDEFFIDLLFYHTRLKCYVVVELKGVAFKPTIGLLLCKTKNRLVAEYALSGIGTPIGVAEYQLVRALPEPLDTNLPSIEEIEAELSRLPTGQAGEEDER